jgi:hypothetical protein
MTEEGSSSVREEDGGEDLEPAGPSGELCGEGVVRSVGDRVVPPFPLPLPAPAIAAAVAAVAPTGGVAGLEEATTVVAAAARTAGEGGAYSSRTPNPMGRWLELKIEASYASNKDGFNGGASSFAGR